MRTPIQRYKVVETRKIGEISCGHWLSSLDVLGMFPCHCDLREVTSLFDFVKSVTLLMMLVRLALYIVFGHHLINIIKSCSLVFSLACG